MATPIEGINTPISTPVAVAVVERNARGCVTKCPECGASLSSNSAAATASLTPEVAAAAPAPAKKGLLGIGFLGLGGRRRARTQRRRRHHGSRKHRRGSRKH